MTLANSGIISQGQRDNLSRPRRSGGWRFGLATAENASVDPRTTRPALRERQHFPPPGPGFLLVDAARNPIFFNSEAIQILAGGRATHVQGPVEDLLQERVQSLLVDQVTCGLIPEFVSGGQSFVCRTFPIESRNTPPGPLLAVLMERIQPEGFNCREIGVKYRLSQREQETIELLVQGLTSKEIASHMQISPNTVKVFIRLTMMKTGVNTRAGLVGKIFQSMSQRQ